MGAGSNHGEALSRLVQQGVIRSDGVQVPVFELRAQLGCRGVPRAVTTRQSQVSGTEKHSMSQESSVTWPEPWGACRG